MGLVENSSWLSNAYDALKGTFLTEFSFFNDALIDPTVYALTLEVIDDRCEHKNLVNETMSLPGKL